MKIILESYSTCTMPILDINTTTVNVAFSRAEFYAVLEYDKARQYDNQKIVIDMEDNPLTFKCRILPIRLNNAVESGGVEITELEITSTSPLFGLYYHQKLLEAINFRPKHLHIRVLEYSLEDSLPEEDCDIISRLEYSSIISFMAKCIGTTDKVSLYCEKVSVNLLRNAYEALERWVVNTPPNTPLNISITAEKDIDDTPCESTPEYQYIQTKLNFVMDCRRYSKEYRESLNTINDKIEIYEKIKNENPSFIKSLMLHHDHSTAKKLVGNDMYNAFKLFCTKDSEIITLLSWICDRYTQKVLPDNAIELIVKYIGGIKEIIRIDNQLEGSNSNTDQQVEMINDINLTTSGTTKDCGYCCIIC